MSVVTYIIVGTLISLTCWVIWLFIWKHLRRKDPETWGDKDIHLLVGGIILIGGATWRAALPVACTVGVGYLLYRLIIKD